MSAWGFVYCMSNPCMPGVYKIGMTTRSPMQRCMELSSSTSAPMPFTLLCYGEILDARDVELELHEMFERERVTSGREFFKASFENIYTAIRESSRNFCATYEGRRCLEAQLNADIERQAAAQSLVSFSETLQ